MSLTPEKSESKTGSISGSEDEEVSCNLKEIKKPRDEERDELDDDNDDEPSISDAPCYPNAKKKRTEELLIEALSKTDQPLSKSQRKKLLKQQKYIEIKKLRKIQRKENQRIKREQRELEGEKVEEASNEQPAKRYTTMASEDALTLKVVIDLSFDDLMSDKDINKLMKQVQRCYALNRRSAHPLQLYFTSFGGKSKQRLDDLEGHYVSWDVHIKSEELIDVFPKEEIVYLSSESPNVLKEIDMSKTYVIGGLVDHNHHKGLCYNMAVERGFGHAQLPIGDFMKLSTRSVLTVNQVFEIFMYYTESKDWGDAFNKVMPQRKITPKIKRRGKNKGVQDEQESKDDDTKNDASKEVDSSE